MTESYVPPVAADGFAGQGLDEPPANGHSNGHPAAAATGEVAKEQAASVGHGAADAGQKVADVAREQAAQVTGEAGRQVKDLFAQAQTQVIGQAGAQQRSLVNGLRVLRDELASMASHADRPGIAADLARQGADRTGAVAGWLDGKPPSAVLDEVTGFARRRPGAFLAVAAGVGFFAGRLTRGLKAQSDRSDQSQQQTAMPVAENNIDGATSPLGLPPVQSLPQTPDILLNDPTGPVVPTPEYLGVSR